jgi:hypothetical protein
LTLLDDMSLTPTTAACTLATSVTRDKHAVAAQSHARADGQPALPAGAATQLRDRLLGELLFTLAAFGALLIGHGDVLCLGHHGLLPELRGPPGCGAYAALSAPAGRHPQAVRHPHTGASTRPLGAHALVAHDVDVRLHVLVDRALQVLVDVAAGVLLFVVGVGRGGGERRAARAELVAQLPSCGRVLAVRSVGEPLELVEFVRVELLQARLELVDARLGLSAGGGRGATSASPGWIFARPTSSAIAPAGISPVPIRGHSASGSSRIAKRSRTFVWVICSFCAMPFSVRP